MKYNLDGKIFQSVENTNNGEVSAETLFHYHQNEEIVSADYNGGSIRRGHLLGTMLEDGTLKFTYHHINVAGELMLGQCLSVPTLLPDGRLQYAEEWQWLNGDKSSGKSLIIEIDKV
ncbi:MAG: n-acetylglutamate synthase [Chloroflexota bacterium]